MKVWTVTRVEDHWPGGRMKDLVGLFSTEELARAYVDDQEPRPAVYWRVQEHELDAGE